MMRFRFLFVLLSLFAVLGGGGAAKATSFNVRDYGAKGDGVALDSPAINAAIEAAAKSGGGTVVLPAGRYLSFSIRLKSNLTLQLEPGAVLVAADPASGLGRYDDPELNEHNEYQDFGHSHWQNSLIWGDGLVNVAIVGHGLIDGSAGLVRYGPPAKRDIPVARNAAGVAQPPPVRNMEGAGNKAIALKNCRNVTLRDFSVLNAGHFALLATGVDHLTIDNLKVDTNRDGFDIDVCRNVRISNCSVNTPHDDAIVLKSSFALGVARDTENVTITNCHVSGFDVGTMLDGSFQRTME
jgi:polygalacturonase